MATLAESPHRPTVGDEGFFLRGAIAMALVIVAGFSTQLAMGRSTFASPLLVHAHAIVFMGWIAIYVTQNVLVATDRISLHRRLGWIAAGWILLMIVLGIAVTVAMARRGQVPFFFRPLHFLVFDPVSLFAFAGLTIAATVRPAKANRLTGSNTRKCSGWKKNGTWPRRAIATVTAIPRISISTIHPAAIQPRRRWSAMRSVATSTFCVT